MKRIATLTLLFLSLLMLSPYQGPAQVFLEIDFAGGALPDGWASEDLSGNGVTWQGCSTPEACGLEGMPPVIAGFRSATAGNGFALANSGATGPLPNDGHISRLTSSPVNCSNRNRVFLQFQTAIATANRNAAENAVIRVMSNAGTKTYQPFSMLEEDNALQAAPVQELANNKAYFVTLDITEVAANQPQVYLEWEWRGNYEFAWLIDDILLSTQNPARPEEAIFFESFDNGSNGWTSNPVFAPDSVWQWALAGDVGNGFGLFFAGRDAFMHSPTGNGGAMAFNADFYNTGGEPPSQGATLNAFVCELISPSIDLSTSEGPLALQFYQLGWLGNLAPGAPQTQEGARFITSFAYSTDGGESWSDPININPYQTPVTSFNVRDVPPFNNSAYFALPEAEGSSDFRLKFTWAGDFYFWVLDDIAIVERKGADMRANRNFFAVTPNAITPVSQLQDEALLCDVVNIGAETAEQVRLEAAVRRKSDNAVVFADTLFFGDIPVDSLVENVFFNEKLGAEALMEAGEYEAFYAVEHNQPDARPEDDTLRWRFIVSDFTFAKEFGPTRDIAPAESKSYSYGNIFYVPNGQGFYACAASFGIANPGQLQGEDITLLLFEWNGELNDDGEIASEGLSFLTGNTYTFTELDGPELIHLPISADNQGFNLKDDTYYVLVLRYDSFFKNCFMQASDTIDYQATWFLNDSLSHPQYASVLDVGNTGTFSTIGFGYNVVPVLRLHLGTGADCLVDTKEAPVSGIHTLEFSPNPANSMVRLLLETGRTYRNAGLEVTTLSGKVAQRTFFGDIIGELPAVDVSQLPPGVYTVMFRSNEYAAAGKLVVQR